MPHLCPNLRYGYGENSVERLLVVYLGLGLSWVCGICFMKCLLFSWPSSSWVLLQVFFKFLLFHVYGCFPCMYVYIIGIKEGVTSNKSLWVLGSFTEAVSALNHRVTSPLLPLHSVSTPQCPLLLFSVSHTVLRHQSHWGDFSVISIQRNHVFLTCVLSLGVVFPTLHGSFNKGFLKLSCASLEMR